MNLVSIYYSENIDKIVLVENSKYGTLKLTAIRSSTSKVDSEIFSELYAKTQLILKGYELIGYYND